MMNLEKRVVALERAHGEGESAPCPACDPGPHTLTITYAADDPDPRTPPGEVGMVPDEVHHCDVCGMVTNIYGTGAA